MAALLAIIGLVSLSTIPVVQGVLELKRAKGAAEQVAAMWLGRQYAIASTSDRAGVKNGADMGWLR